MTITVSDEVLEVSSVDTAALISAATSALKRPSESHWSDEEMWVTHTMMFQTPAWWLTEDYIVDQANYRAVLRDLSENYPDDVSDSTFGHWTYSTYQAIKVRVLDENGGVTKAFADAYGTYLFIKEQYPVYDEELLSQMESEVFDEYLDGAISDIERERSEDEDWVALSQWREYFKSYVSEQVSWQLDGVKDDILKEAAAFADKEMKVLR